MEIVREKTETTHRRPDWTRESISARWWWLKYRVFGFWHAWKWRKHLKG